MRTITEFIDHYTPYVENFDFTKEFGVYETLQRKTLLFENAQTQKEKEAILLDLEKANKEVKDIVLTKLLKGVETNFHENRGSMVIVFIYWEYKKLYEKALIKFQDNDLYSEDERIQGELIHISKAENKFNKGIPMQVVIDHFKVFTTTKNQKGEYYLTGDQFVKFLKRCFLNDENEPIQKINAPGEKGAVIKRFYEFYELACIDYSVPRPKEPFIDRFTDSFEFGTRKSFESFFKGTKSKKQW